MSQRRKYYVATTKQLLTSKFIYQKANHVYKMNKGSITSNISKSYKPIKITQSANLKNILVLMSLTRKIPATLKCAKVPGKLFLRAKRVSVLHGYAFMKALDNWIAALEYSTRYRQRIASITPNFITLTNRQTKIKDKIRFLFQDKPQKKFSSFGDKETKTSVSFAIKEGTLFSKIFFINFFKFIKR